ncbi:MAG: GDSL-type esterase/lipase family protein, partial [Planctomycetota bacterium]
MKALNVLLALLVSAGIALGVAEVGLRALGYSPAPVNTEFDPELGWRKTPGKTIVRSTPEFDVTLTSDGAGLRDDHGALAPAPEGATRALFLGDSFVVGYTVDREDLFVDQLERALQAEGRAVEVMNAGTQGYSTDQSLRWLELHGEEVAPDVVVYFPYENDIWWNSRPTYLDLDKPLYDDAGELVERALAEPAPRHWSRSLAIGEAWYRLVAAPDKPTVEAGDASIDVELSSRLTAPPAATQAAEGRTRKLIEVMAARSAELGARLVVCPIPSRAHVEAVAGEALPAADAPVDPARPHRIFLEAAREAGAAVIDPLPTLASYARSASPYYQRDFHLNPAGNVALAVALHGALAGGPDGGPMEGIDGGALLPPRAEGAPTVLPAGPEDAGQGPPSWLLWYLGLTALLGTMYVRTYRDVPAAVGLGSVAALLAVVFGTALGVGWVVEELPPRAAQLTVLALVLAILTFIL